MANWGATLFAKQNSGLPSGEFWIFVQRVPQKSAETNFCANGGKPRNTGVVGEAGGPLVPTTPSDPGLLHFAKKLIFAPSAPRGIFARGAHFP